MNAAHLCHKGASVSVNKSLNSEHQETCSCILTFIDWPNMLNFLLRRGLKGAVFVSGCCFPTGCCGGGLTLQVSDGFGCEWVASESFEVNAGSYLLSASCWLLVAFCESNTRQSDKMTSMLQVLDAPSGWRRFKQHVKWLKMWQLTSASHSHQTVFSLFFFSILTPQHKGIEINNWWFGSLRRNWNSNCIILTILLWIPSFKERKTEIFLLFPISPRCVKMQLSLKEGHKPQKEMTAKLNSFLTFFIPFSWLHNIEGLLCQLHT